MKLTILFIFLGLTFCYAQKVQNSKSTTNQVEFPKSDQFKNSKLSYKIIPAANSTWCYEILTDGKLFIHQPSIPGVQGNEGFKTKESATKVAELVISKIKRGEVPPSVTLDEIKKLNAL